MYSEYIFIIYFMRARHLHVYSFTICTLVSKKKSVHIYSSRPLLSKHTTSRYFLVSGIMSPRISVNVNDVMRTIHRRVYIYIHDTCTQYNVLINFSETVGTRGRHCWRMSPLSLLRISILNTYPVNYPKIYLIRTVDSR